MAEDAVRDWVRDCSLRGAAKQNDAKPKQREEGWMRTCRIGGWWLSASISSATIVEKIGAWMCTVFGAGRTRGATG